MILSQSTSALEESTQYEDDSKQEFTEVFSWGSDKNGQLGLG